MNDSPTPDLVTRVRALATELGLPHPGEGHTAERWRALAAIARHDVAEARVIEAHVDALSILHEAGLEPEPSALYGVWAAEEPGRSLELDGDRVRGQKPFCTGSGMVDRALVTARTPAGVVLVEIDARHPSIDYATDDWVTPAFAATGTATATLHTPTIRTVGSTGWYLDRVGFWHGACGPAACWAGGVLGLIDQAVAAAATKSAEPHLNAHIGALVAIGWELEAVLDRAGDEIDDEPDDDAAAIRRARILRHLVDRAASEVIERFGRALGPRPLVRDSEVVRRIAEVQLYVRQCHAERDLDALGAAETDRR
jgi:alkylation response protein AidB-like acyl-CoA dehydrogenase